MDRKENKNDLRRKIKECIVKMNENSKYYKMEWALGEKENNTRFIVCKQAFCNVYGVSSSHVDNIVKEIKAGERSTQPSFNDRTKVELTYFPDLLRIAKAFGLYLSKKQVIAAKLPNSPLVLTAYGWMAAHFELVGDKAPNRDEIHLEPIYIVDVYGEYVVDMKHADMSTVSVDTFANMDELF
jgi:hypothetical protein